MQLKEFRGTATPTAVIEAFKGEVSLGTVTVGKGGAWVLPIPDTVQAGDSITFVQTIDGKEIDRVTKEIEKEIEIVVPVPGFDVDKMKYLGSQKLSGTGQKGYEIKLWIFDEGLDVENNLEYEKLTDPNHEIQPRITETIPVGDDGTWETSKEHEIEDGDQIVLIQLMKGNEKIRSMPFLHKVDNLEPKPPIEKPEKPTINPVTKLGEQYISGTGVPGKWIKLLVETKDGLQRDSEIIKVEDNKEWSTPFSMNIENGDVITAIQLHNEKDADNLGSDPVSITVAVEEPKPKLPKPTIDPITIAGQHKVSGTAEGGKWIRMWIYDENESQKVREHIEIHDGKWKSLNENPIKVGYSIKAIQLHNEFDKDEEGSEPTIYHVEIPKEPEPEIIDPPTIDSHIAVEGDHTLHGTGKKNHEVRVWLYASEEDAKEDVTSTGKSVWFELLLVDEEGKWSSVNKAPVKHGYVIKAVQYKRDSETIKSEPVFYKVPDKPEPTFDPPTGVEFDKENSTNIDISVTEDAEGKKTFSGIVMEGTKGRLVAKVLPPTAKQEVRWETDQPGVLEIDPNTGEFEAVIVSAKGETVTVIVKEDEMIQAYMWVTIVENPNKEKQENTD